MKNYNDFKTIHSTIKFNFVRLGTLLGMLIDHKGDAEGVRKRNYNNLLK